jgi:GNAT superfamily N-acetyltransferase
MSDLSRTSTHPPAGSASRPAIVTPSTSAPAWRIRTARREDAEAVAAAVRELLVELGGAPLDVGAMREAARALIGSPSAGAVLVARADEELVGVLAASWQMAIHVPGAYALIQDLWVRRSWRGRAIGGDLLGSLFELARARGLQRVEVGLPRESFAEFAATEAFYLGNGFTPNGPRMRRILS